MLRSYGRVLQRTRHRQYLSQTRLLHVSTPCNAPACNDSGIGTDDLPKKRGPGQPRNDAVPCKVAIDGDQINNASHNIETTPDDGQSSPRKPKLKQSAKSSKLPPRLVQTSSNHHDLDSFLAYADRVDLNRNTNVYKGTLYEYMVASTLRHFSFQLHRTGRSNDLGIDLVGHFYLPSAAKTGRKATRDLHELKVVVQCKALKPTPAMVREREGAYVGAPAGWRGEGVLALLVASKEATKGVRDALQRSRWPMGLLQVTAEGEVRQFLWNAVAEEIGLAGLGVTVKYADGVKKTTVGQSDTGSARAASGSIVLTWMGEMWKSAEVAK